MGIVCERASKRKVSTVVSTVNLIILSKVYENSAADKVFAIKLSTGTSRWEYLHLSEDDAGTSL